MIKTLEKNKLLFSFLALEDSFLKEMKKYVYKHHSLLGYF